MGESSNSPRFRIRLEDGAEVPINSVEALARRVARGDLEPETPLYDESTGAWLKASEAPVVRFILEEMDRDGAELPERWSSGQSATPLQDSPDTSESEAASSDPPPPASEQASTSLEGLPVSDSPRDPVDPFAFDLTLAPEPEATPEVEPDEAMDEGEEIAMEGPASPVPSVSRVSRGSERTEADEWMTPRDAGGLFTHTVRDEEVPEEIPPMSAISPRGSAVVQWFRRGTAWEQLRRVSLLAGGVLLLGAGLVFGPFGGEDGPGGEVDNTADAQAAPLLPETPTGLADAVELSAVRIAQGYQTAADSLRAEGGLPDSPPEPWLGGYYLANASEFPEVAQFWSAYRAFVAELRALDRVLFQNSLSDALESSGATPEQVPELESYLEGRYLSTAPTRQLAYDQLDSVGNTALDLHTFLVGSSEALQFTPALGGASVPRDPVLEVGTEDRAVRSELDLRLDALFEALERSRGGGAPSQAGLRAELFEGFAVF